LIGEHKWPSSKKTVEGTLIAMLTTYVFMSFVSELIAFEQTVPELPAILAFSTSLPIWEAVSDQNDNLTLPIVAFAISRLVF
jgi:dolichol kinase